MQTTELLVERAVLPDVVATGVRVACAGGRIAAVACEGDAPAGAPAGAAQRLAGTLLPGFVDLQVNGAGGRSVDECTDDALDAIAAAVFAGGAVAFLPTLITAPFDELLARVRAVAAWIGRWNGRGAEPLGLHVEGPFLHNPGVHDEDAFVDPTRERLDALLAAADGRLRLATLASSRAGAAEATAHLRRHGVTVAIGHVATADGLLRCVDAGAAMVTHLFNAMGAIHHRDPGVAGFALDDERLACALIADGAHVHPAMVRNAYRILGPDRLVLVSDASAPAGAPEGEYRLAGMAVRSSHGIVRDARGVLAGSALTMGLAARNFLSFVPSAGTWTLARIAAANPARLAAVADLGAIASGRRAAFTLLADDGSVRCVRP